MEDIQDVVDLLALARSDPQRALSLGKKVVASHDNDTSEKAIAARAVCIAARSASTIEESIRYGHLSVELSQRASDADLRSAALGSLAGSLTISGRAAVALDLLAEAAVGAQGLLRAQLVFQRGAIFDVEGLADEALDAYAEAMPLFELFGDDEFRALTLKNRGELLARRGDLDDGERELVAAREINARLGMWAEVAGLDLNLGMLYAFRGDLARALECLIEGDQRLMDIMGADTPQHVVRAEVLVSSGLYLEALELATRIASDNSRQGDAHHASLAYLVGARAALLADRSDAAIELAASARRSHGSLELEPFLLQADLIRVIAEYRRYGANAQLADQVSRLDSELGRRHFLVASAEAKLLAGRIYLDLGEVDKAKAVLDQVARIDRGPVEIRVQARLARALVRRHRGDTRGAVAAARSGLKMLDDYQAALGSSDLRAGIESWGTELGELGLELALESGHPRRAFEWMERTRARSLIAPRVLPSDDPEESQATAELRIIEAALRDGNGDPPELTRRRQKLQERIKEIHRSQKGAGGLHHELVVDDLTQRLGDRHLVEYAAVGGRLWAAEIREGRFTVTGLGNYEELLGEFRHLRLQMRKAARTGGGLERLQESIGRVGGLLFEGLELGSSRLVIVPTPDILALPWSVFPHVGEAELVISPSAAVWALSDQRRSRRRRSALIAGPGLEHAESELESLAGLYSDEIVLGPVESRVDLVSDAFGDVDVAHAACHATFQADSPMFSSLHLSDGNLNVYDIERLKRVPSMVVLSACDSGFTDTRAGEELTGVTAALLRMGCKTVVASVGLVPDTEATKALMLAFHKGVTGGMAPAAALRAAGKAVEGLPGGITASASFVCVGSG